LTYNGFQQILLSIVSIITVVIGGVTVALLFTLLVMMRTMYVLVRWDTTRIETTSSCDPAPDPVEP